MDIELDPSQKRQLETEAKRLGKTPEEYVAELLSASLFPAAKVDKTVAEEQYEETLKLMAELDTMEEGDTTPDTGSTDHNEFIYGRKAPK
jgi:hypothetical protein